MTFSCTYETRGDSMPKRNDAERRAQRKRTAELKQSSSLNLRLLGTVAAELQRVREDEEHRLCDECHLPKWECELLAEEDGAKAHIFSPMAPEQQLRYEDERATPLPEEIEMPKQHFPGHAADCKMAPSVCYATAGISARP